MVEMTNRQRQSIQAKRDGCVHPEAFEELVARKRRTIRVPSSRQRIHVMRVKFHVVSDALRHTSFRNTARAYGRVLAPDRQVSSDAAGSAVPLVLCNEVN